MNTHRDHELVVFAVIRHDFSQRKCNYQNQTCIVIFATLEGKIACLKCRCHLKNFHCGGPRRWQSLSFLIANKAIEVCTNDRGILSCNFVKNNHDSY